ncbi:MAG: sugar phosphate isomerase/epimerase family protein [Chloroflexota bacterium]
MYISLGLGPIGAQAPLATAIEYAKRYQFGGLDINIQEVADLVDEKGADAVKAMFAEANIVPGCWGMPVNTRGDESTWQEGLAALPRLAKAGQAIGALRVSTFIMPGHNELDYQANFDFHTERLRPIAQILADHNLRFGLEWVGTKTLRESFKYPFLYTMEEAIKLGEAIGTPNMGLLVDIYHVENSGATAEDVRRLTNEQVVYAHVNDGVAGVPADERHDTTRDLPGYTGELDLRAFLQALNTINYDGPVTCEPFSQRLRDLPDEDAIAEVSAAMHKGWRAAGLS